MSDNSYFHILKYAGLFGGVQGLSVLVGIVRNKFSALFLGPSGMGLLALLNSNLSLLSAITNLGIPTSGVRVLSDAKSREDSVCMVRSLALLSAIGGAMLCVLLIPLADFHFGSSSWGNRQPLHRLHFLLLAPSVFFTVLAGGETAILKGAGKLKALAMQASVLALLSLLFSIPIYYLWGANGILMVLFLLAFSQWGLCFLCSLREFPFRLNYSRKMLLRGMPMIRLGLSFVLAGIMNAGAEVVIRGFLEVQSGLEAVGLFNAAITIVLVYGGMLFSVMDSDYYPRLSAIAGRRLSKRAMVMRNLVISRQVEMNVVLMVPIVIGLILLLPYLIPVLYNQDFMDMQGMAQIASVGLLFRAIYLPVEYIPLSRGDAKVYLLQEGCAAFLLLCSELYGYLLGGLTGVGWGILAAYAVETVGVLLFSRFYYGFRLSFGAAKYRQG